MMNVNELSTPNNPGTPKMFHDQGSVSPVVGAPLPGELRFNSVTPSFGRGIQLSRMLENSFNREVGASVSSPQEHDSQPQSGENAENGAGSEVHPDSSQTFMLELIKTMGQEIGNSIVTSLSSSNAHSQKVDPQTVPLSPKIPDWSQVNLVMKADVREPPTFRGDGTDKCNVYEWEEMMQTYLKRKGFEVSEQGVEIMDRLMGRAKDVVKIGIRGNSLANISTDPEVIYRVLKQHYGEPITSTTPLADFYATVPYQGEGSIDYWVRLNKAGDLANECLQRQGKQIEDMGYELAMMFVRHCPNPELSAAFRCKPRTKWTVGEVQEMLDSYQNDKHATRKRVQHTMFVQEDIQLAGETVLTSAVQGVRGGDEQATMTKLVTLFEQFLKTQNSTQPARVFRNAVQQPPNYPCAICGDGAHSTRSHCLNERLCFKCHKSGHQNVNCPQKQGDRRGPPVTQLATDQTQSLNL